MLSPANMSLGSVPDTYSKPLDFALPICGMSVPTEDCNVPLELVATSKRLTDLNASISPVTNVTSGCP